MFVKTLIFVGALIAVTGNLRAGVISATWLDQESGLSVTKTFDSDPSTPAPADGTDEQHEAFFDAGCSSGMTGVASPGGGSSPGGVAWSGAAIPYLLDRELDSRLRSKDEILPASPILSGLLKPS